MDQHAGGAHAGLAGHPEPARAPARTVAYRITGNRVDADECLQETFVGALECARQARIRHWGALLRRLATARAVDRVREGRREPSGHVADVTADQSPEQTGP
jgi:DNA-directed RNA polymerase specialized sigma24 family protein